MTRGLQPRQPRPDLTVLVVADPPPTTARPNGEDPAGRHEALVALARAVFSAGGRLAVPADTGVSLLLGTVALEYAAPPVAERHMAAERPRLLVMETERRDEWARQLLTPLVIRGAIDYVDENGQPIGRELRAGLDGPTFPDANDSLRQRVTPALLQSVEANAAVLLSPARAALDDLRLLRVFGIRTVTLRNTAHDDLEDELSEVDDPRARLQVDNARSRWADTDEPDTQPAVPYTYIMQRLVSEWIS
jgi:hypothetical protein